jgi:hypothetical protein
MTTVLRMYRGDSQVFDVVVTDLDGVAQDITTSDLRFTAKHRYQDDDTDAVIAKTLGDGITLGGGTGEATITLEPEDTDLLSKNTTLEWDLQVTDSTGSVRTAARGRLIISADISVTTP